LLRPLFTFLSAVSNSVTCKNPKTQQASLFSFFFLCFQIGFSSFPLFRSASLFTDLFFLFVSPSSLFQVAGAMTKELLATVFLWRLCFCGVCAAAGG
jgi:hypothetical protein